MSTLENDEKKTPELKEHFLSWQHLCLKKEWILRLNQEEQISDCICLICKQIANYPVEINCSQHQHLDEPLIVGEHCLKQYLNQNSNYCPIETHKDCQYARNKLAQRSIHKLQVICPLQFEQESRISDQVQAKRINCNFNGKIDELKDHLENLCPLRLSPCWFKPFGCNHNGLKHELEQHLISNMQFHFNLVIKSFQTLQQTMQSLQEESKKLQVQNEKLILEVQLKKLKEEENITLSKEYSNKIIIEIEELKKCMKHQLKQRQILETENQKMKEAIQSIEKNKQTNEQELFKLCDSSKIQITASKKEGQISFQLHPNHNSKQPQDDQNFLQLCSLYKRDEQMEYNFDLFCSSSKLINTFTGHTDT
ncbi:hypothetical protein RFI_31895, partial [Reticulomyxa filosa]